MEIVKYHNQINSLKLGNFSEIETNIFFSLLLRAKEKKENLIILDFSDLQGLIESPNRSKQRFIKSILGLNQKLKSLNQTVEVEKGVYKTFSLFGSITTDTNKNILKVPIDQDFSYMIDDLIGNFTIFDLKELISLKGNYAKTLFRLLKQWEGTNKFIISMEEFRETLSIPEKYKMFNIDQKVLNPVLEELEKFFPSLQIEKIKNGVKIEKLKFTWIKKIQKIVRKNEIASENFEEYQESDIQLSEDEEKRALDLLDNQIIFVEMKRKAEKIYWKTLNGVLNGKKK
ncbi:MAG: replication initiation protein [Cetobacterium sp.]